MQPQKAHARARNASSSLALLQSDSLVVRVQRYKHKVMSHKETSTSLALVGELQDGANPTQAQL